MDKKIFFGLVRRECFFNGVIGITSKYNGNDLNTAKPGNAGVRPNAGCGFIR